MTGKVKALDRDILNHLIERSHIHIKDVVKIYGEQGAQIILCPVCGLLILLHCPKGLTCAGPSLSSTMYCQHRKEPVEVRRKKKPLFTS